MFREEFVFFVLFGILVYMDAIRNRILGFVGRYRALVGIGSVVLLVGAAWLSDGHTTLALLCVAPVVLGGGIVIALNVSAVRTLESLGNEEVQRYVMETGADVASMPQGKRNKLARRWARRSLSPRLFAWIGAVVLLGGFAALVVFREWTGALVVGMLLMLMVYRAFRP